MQVWRGNELQEETKKLCLRCKLFVYLTHCSEARGRAGSGLPAATCLAAVYLRDMNLPLQHLLRCGSMSVAKGGVKFRRALIF